MTSEADVPSLHPWTVDERGAARLLGVSVRYLQDARWKGEGPRYVRFGRSIRYRVDDLREYMEALPTFPADNDARHD